MYILCIKNVCALVTCCNCHGGTTYHSGRLVTAVTWSTTTHSTVCVVEARMSHPVVCFYGISEHKCPLKDEVW